MLKHWGMICSSHMGNKPLLIEQVCPTAEMTLRFCVLAFCAHSATVDDAKAFEQIQKTDQSEKIFVTRNSKQ